MTVACLIHPSPFDYHIVNWSIGGASIDLADSIDMLHSADDLTEHGVRAIQVAWHAVTRYDVELAACRIGVTGPSHGKGSWPMRQPIVSFARYCHIRSIASCCKLTVTVTIPVTSIPAGSILVLKVTSLYHESSDDSVEDCIVVRAVLNVGHETIHMERGFVRIEIDYYGAVDPILVPRRVPRNVRDF